MPTKLSVEQIKNFSSTLISEGRPAELWEIRSVEIEGDQLNADISMVSTFNSPTDTKGFHLSIFSALEMVSQLMLIYCHHWAGYEKKTKEGWMVESHLRCKQAIRSTEKIHLAMRCTNIRRMKDKVYSSYVTTITDEMDGLFEAKTKSFLG